jgi:flavin reductase (DIM6/NTAB) family NADH-FMN oxidoreductase RutF
MKKKIFPLSKVYQLLEPGPVVMVTTERNGKPNIMTMTWHMMLDFEPPTFACVISNRNYSFKNISDLQECVINIPSAELANTVIGVGNCSGARVDKFKKFHLTQQPASKVHPPMIAECFANLECKVIDTQLAHKYNVFILQVVKAWMAPLKKRPRTLHHCGRGVFIVDGKLIKIPTKMKK